MIPMLTRLNHFIFPQTLFPQKIRKTEMFSCAILSLNDAGVKNLLKLEIMKAS